MLRLTQAGSPLASGKSGPCSYTETKIELAKMRLESNYHGKDKYSKCLNLQSLCTNIRNINEAGKIKYILLFTIYTPLLSSPHLNTLCEYFGVDIGMFEHREILE
jgi:hypothetical protein